MTRKQGSSHITRAQGEQVCEHAMHAEGLRLNKHVHNSTNYAQVCLHAARHNVILCACSYSPADLKMCDIHAQ